MRLVLLFLFAVVAVNVAASPARLLDPTLTTRVGYDSNPLGTGGASAALLGSDSTFAYGAVLGFGIANSTNVADPRAFRLNYTGEFVRFDESPGEDYFSHRFGATGRLALDEWKLAADLNSLLIAGSRDTLTATSALNANATALWRERRRQWQHRMKLQAQKERGDLVLRTSAALLAYDYETHVVAGKFAFADRSDAVAAADVGWKQTANSLWLAGVRAGRQVQERIPLPNCDFDYSNNYVRFAAGWEGKPRADVSVSFQGGADFRHYYGKVDPITFPDRDRTSLWFDGAFTVKLSPSVALTGKAIRNDWLSSTGKSAYNDLVIDSALTWTANRKWTLRLTAKVHRSEFFPVIRDDWESLFGAGASVTLSPHTQLAVDAVSHRGWNGLAGSPEREFDRAAVNVGLVTKF